MHARKPSWAVLACLRVDMSILLGRLTHHYPLDSRRRRRRSGNQLNLARRTLRMMLTKCTLPFPFCFQTCTNCYLNNSIPFPSKNYRGRIWKISPQHSKSDSTIIYTRSTQHNTITILEILCRQTPLYRLLRINSTPDKRYRFTPYHHLHHHPSSSPSSSPPTTTMSTTSTSSPSLPSHYGMTLTPTIHSTIPPSLAPTLTSLPRPFIAVVTGAGKGLGYHISLAFARSGCTGISISSRTMGDLEKLEEEIRKVGGKEVEVLKSVCDVTSEDSVRKLEEEVRAKWGRVDVVVANAGVISNYVTRPKNTPTTPSASSGDVKAEEEQGQEESNLPIGILEDDDWARVLDINLHGTWRLSRAFMPLLLDTSGEEGGGSGRGPKTLICSTSLASHSVDSQMTPIAYNVSKIACNRLIEHVANDHGGKGVQA